MKKHKARNSGPPPFWPPTPLSPSHPSSPPFLGVSSSLSPTLQGATLLGLTPLSWSLFLGLAPLSLRVSVLLLVLRCVVLFSVAEAVVVCAVFAVVRAGLTWCSPMTMNRAGRSGRSPKQEKTNQANFLESQNSLKALKAYMKDLLIAVVVLMSCWVLQYHRHKHHFFRSSPQVASISQVFF